MGARMLDGARSQRAEGRGQRAGQAWCGPWQEGGEHLQREGRGGGDTWRGLLGLRRTSQETGDSRL